MSAQLPKFSLLIDLILPLGVAIVRPKLAPKMARHIFSAKARAQLAFARAVQNEDVELVAALLPRVDPNAADPNGRWALTEAVRMRREKIFDLLLPVVDAKQPSENGSTALMLAAQIGRVDWIERLLPLSDPDALDANGCSAIMLAARCGQGGSVQALLDASDLSKRSDHLLGTGLLGLCAAFCDEETVRMAAGRIEREAPNRDDVTPLMLAADEGNAGKARAVLSKCDPLARDNVGRTALMRFAASETLSRQQPEAVRECAALLSGACDPAARLGGHPAAHLNGLTAFEIAAAAGRWPQADALCDGQPREALRSLLERAAADPHGAVFLPRAQAQLDAAELSATLCASGARQDAPADPLEEPARRAPRL
jgi:ankyrin repeat protein